MNIPFWTSHGTIDLMDLQPAHFSAEIVGDALAKLNRFTGRTVNAWPVAAHSVLVERLCPPSLGPWALLHDAHEIILGDMTEPAIEFISRFCGFAGLEDSIAEAKARLDLFVSAAWNVPVRSANPGLQRADRVALCAEAFLFLGHMPQLFQPGDEEEIDRAITIIREFPDLKDDWRLARDLWRGRVDHYSARGGMCPPAEH